MQSIRYKFIELILIFIAIPVSYNFNYSPILKLIIGVFGFIYVTYVLLKIEKNKFSINKNLKWKTFWKSTLIKFLIIAIIACDFNSRNVIFPRKVTRTKCNTCNN